jgi:hypothetical protein
LNTAFFQIELKRSILRWQFWLAIILMGGLIIHGYHNAWIEAIHGPDNAPFASMSPADHTVFKVFIYGQGYTGLSFIGAVWPLIAALIAGDSLAWDRKSGYLQSVLLRIGYKKYIIGKILSISAITFIVIFLAESLLFAYGLIQFPIHDPSQMDPQYYPKYGSNLFSQFPYLYSFLIIFNASLFGAVTASMCLLISTKIRNLMVVVALPWIIYIVLSFVIQVIGLVPFAPIILTADYFSYHSDIWIIPLIWILSWGIISYLTYQSFQHQFKKKGSY